jgi:hypothetical protein
VDHEAVPGHVEREDMITAFVHREAVPRPESPSTVSFRAPANRGLAGLFDGDLIDLTFLGARGRFGSF